MSKRRILSAIQEIRDSSSIIANSGISVNVLDNDWILLPYQGKGWKISVGWIHSSNISEIDRVLILDVIIFYARMKAASTTAGVVTNTKPLLSEGIPSLEMVKARWSGLQTNNKKGLNQFFGTLVKLGNVEFCDFHNFTSTHLDKTNSNALDPSRGALSKLEFDSFARQINRNLQLFDWGAVRDLSFYQSQGAFNALINKVTNKLLLAIVRRPIQIAALKWSDLIPVGTSYGDSGIKIQHEIGSIGADSLQLRVFSAKSRGTGHARSAPERYPLPLSEALSHVLLEYKKVFIKGITLLLEAGSFGMTQSEIMLLVNNMPMFPDCRMFEMELESPELVGMVFSPSTLAFHLSESAVTHAIRLVRISSDRMPDCVVTSNRIRHTVLTRGAQDGLPVAHLAKITGVTVPAARHYIDLNYESRRQIDSRYIGNEFLKAAFSDVISVAPEGDGAILDNEFVPLGGVHQKSHCIDCPTKMGRPLGCYGCSNFRPLLEANHDAVLIAAERKLEVNRTSLISPLHFRTVEKLETQISWIKITIAACSDILERKRAIND